MGKARILVVEDEVIIAMEIESSLLNLGYEVTSVVSSSEDAIKKAEEEKPHLVLMDIRIQGDKDGIEAAEIIRNRFEIPVVFSTAYLDEERIERAKITMPFGYVLKPVQERDLKVTLEMALYVAKVDAKRKNIEEDLKKSLETLSLVLENIPLAVFVHDLHGKLVLVNRVSTQYTGYSKDELLTMTVGDIDHESLIRHDSDQIWKRLQYGDHCRFNSKHIRKDGSVYAVEIHATAFTLQGQPVILTIINDVTERTL